MLKVGKYPRKAHFSFRSDHQGRLGDKNYAFPLTHCMYTNIPGLERLRAVGIGEQHVKQHRKEDSENLHH